MLTIADGGGRGVQEPMILADVICEQPLINKVYLLKYENSLQGWIACNVMLMLQLCQSEILEGCQLLRNYQQSKHSLPTTFPSDMVGSTCFAWLV